MLFKSVAAFLSLLVINQEQIYNFYCFYDFSSARKAINTFIFSKHDALQSMTQGSCFTEAGVAILSFYRHLKAR